MNVNKLDIIELEEKRLVNLALVSHEYQERENNEPLPIALQSITDHIVAMTENEEAYSDVATGLEYTPVELHMRYCDTSGVEYCVCGSNPLRKRITMTPEPF